MRMMSKNKKEALALVQLISLSMNMQFEKISCKILKISLMKITIIEIIHCQSIIKQAQKMNFSNLVREISLSETAVAAIAQLKLVLSQ